MNGATPDMFPDHDPLSQATWPGEVLETWQTFAQRAELYVAPQRQGRLILFRGQSQQWRLAPLLRRCIPSEVQDHFAALRAEQAAKQHFRARAHLYGAVPDRSSSAIHNSVFEWWPLMQHHGVPTRLLDWTASPYVAAYLAARDDLDKDGCVLVIDGTRVRDHYLRSVTKGEESWHHELPPDPGTYETAPLPAPHEGLWLFTPTQKTQRVAVQQGYFTVATHALAVHDDLLLRAGAIVRRLVIPARLKRDALFHLRAMNIMAESLFPGLDGLGRSTGERVRGMFP